VVLRGGITHAVTTKEYIKNVFVQFKQTSNPAVVFWGQIDCTLSELLCSAEAF